MPLDPEERKEIDELKQALDTGVTRDHDLRLAINRLERGLGECKDQLVAIRDRVNLIDDRSKASNDASHQTKTNTDVILEVLQAQSGTLTLHHNALKKVLSRRRRRGGRRD